MSHSITRFPDYPIPIFSSTACLKAASVWFQNCSKYARSASIPAGSTV